MGKKNVVAAALKKAGITTMADLDEHIRRSPKTDTQGRPYLMSRYQALKELVGEDAATSMMNELSLQTCCKTPRRG